MVTALYTARLVLRASSQQDFDDFVAEMAWSAFSKNRAFNLKGREKPTAVTRCTCIACTRPMRRRT